MIGGSAASAPCACQHASAGGTLESQTMYPTAEPDLQENAWRSVSLGADAPGVQARGTLKHDGPFLHGYLKYRLPGESKVHMITMSLDLRDVEAALEQAVDASAPGLTTASSGGRIARKIKHGIKSAAKKVAKSKIARTLVSVAEKAFNNPLIKGLIAAAPGGAAMLATAAAARVAAKAIKGGIKAKQALHRIAQNAKAGHPDAIRAARLIKTGLALTGIKPQVSVNLRTAAAAGEPEYLAAIVGACVDCAPTNVGLPWVGCGDDTQHDAEPHELDALETFATSGAFEGVRWLASRLGLHSMADPRTGFSRQGALLLGMQLYAPH